MNLKHLICTVTAASLLTVAWTSVAFAQHEGHGGGGAGTLPDSVRDVLGPFRDLSEAISQGYGLFQGCVSGPNEGAMGVHYVNGMLFDPTQMLSRKTSASRASPSTRPPARNVRAAALGGDAAAGGRSVTTTGPPSTEARLTERRSSPQRATDLD